MYFPFNLQNICNNGNQVPYIRVNKNRRRLVNMTHPAMDLPSSVTQLSYKDTRIECYTQNRYDLPDRCFIAPLLVLTLLIIVIRGFVSPFYLKICHIFRNHYFSLSLSTLLPHVMKFLGGGAQGNLRGKKGICSLCDESALDPHLLRSAVAAPSGAAARALKMNLISGCTF